MTPAKKKLLSYLFKAIILVLAYVFIYREIVKKGPDILKFQSLLNHIGHATVLLVMSAIFLLMFVNWLLEALKWQYITRHLGKISFWQAIECVFCGLTWAIFTPNRLGEYGGRVMFLSPRKRIYGVFAMGVGSFGQNVITNVLGAVAILWFTVNFLHLNSWASFGCALVGIGYITIFLIVYFHIKWLVILLNNIPFLKKYSRFFNVMGSYKFNELLKIMLFCLARFFSFSLQYYILLHLLIPQITATEILMMTFVVLFIQSALPSLDLLDIAVRSYTAIAVFSYVTDQKVAVVAVFSTVWLINLIIPAILGTVFNLKLNFFDRNI